jgi:hypothetical protein
MPYYPPRLSILRCASNVMAVAAVGLAISLAGCAEPPREGDGTAEGAEVPRAEPASRAPAAPVPRFASRLIGEPAPHEPELGVALIDAGREPRRLLRYGAERGARQRVHIQGKGTSDLQVGGRLIYSQADVATDASFEVHVVAADADRIECELRFERALTSDWEKFQPGRATELRRPLDRLADHVYRFSMDRRGFVRLPPLELPPEMDVDSDRNITWGLLEEAVRSIVMLPAEPVGIGARWRSVEEERGRILMAGRLSTEVELVALRGRRLELQLSYTFIVPPQLLDLNTSPGALSGVSRIQSAVRGRAAVDLGLLQPVELEIRSSVQMDGAWLDRTERLPMRVLAAGSQSLVAR